MKAFKELCLSSCHQAFQACVLDCGPSLVSLLTSKAPAQEKKPLATLVALVKVSRTTLLRLSSQMPSTVSEYWSMQVCTCKYEMSTGLMCFTPCENSAILEVKHLQFPRLLRERPKGIRGEIA